MRLLGRRISILLMLFLATWLQGCVSIPSVESRVQSAERIAKQYGWSASVIETKSFDLMSYQQPDRLPVSTLAVYIEGDGLAWITSRQASLNPTPLNPVALKLALNDSQHTAVYLGRVCQYVEHQQRGGCNKRYWMGERFAPLVVDAMNEAVDQLKRDYQADTLVLVGFSGGGTIVALLAARRHDVSKLITVAGNLDHQAWTEHHRISPLIGSLNPADAVKELSLVDQLHFVGAQDTVIPPALITGFVNRLGTNTHARVVVVPNQDHNCCWSEHWSRLLNAEMP